MPPTKADHALALEPSLGPRPWFATVPPIIPSSIRTMLTSVQLKVTTLPRRMRRRRMGTSAASLLTRQSIWLSETIPFHRLLRPMTIRPLGLRHLRRYRTQAHAPTPSIPSMDSWATSPSTLSVTLRDSGSWRPEPALTVVSPSTNERDHIQVALDLFCLPEPLTLRLQMADTGHGVPMEDLLSLPHRQQDERHTTTVTRPFLDLVNPQATHPRMTL